MNRQELMDAGRKGNLDLPSRPPPPSSTTGTNGLCHSELTPLSAAAPLTPAMTGQPQPGTRRGKVGVGFIHLPSFRETRDWSKMVYLLKNYRGPSESSGVSGVAEARCDE